MRIIFMGTPNFAVPSLEALLRSEHEVVGIVTQPDRPKGRGQKLAFSPVKQLAQDHRLPLLQPEKMKSPELLKALANWRPDVIAVTAFGRILPKSILGLPLKGCVNVHGSLLPQYRGAAPIQWSLINGGTETGITTILMDEGMDTGPMLLQKTVAIEPDDTSAELGNRLAKVGGDLLVETLKRLENKTMVPREQEHDKATYAPILTKEAGLIDWTQSAEHIANRIRGLSPWPGCYTFLQDQRLTIWKAMVETQTQRELLPAHGPGVIISIDEKSFEVLTGNGILRVTEVQLVNKKRMTVKQFLQGRNFSVEQAFTSSST